MKKTRILTNEQKETLLCALSYSLRRLADGDGSSSDCIDLEILLSMFENRTGVLGSEKIKSFEVIIVQEVEK